MLNSIQAFDLPERRESASPPAPAPTPATLLPVYVMLPLDTVWPVERDGKKARTQVFAHVCAPHCATQVRPRMLRGRRAAHWVFALRLVCLWMPSLQRSVLVEEDSWASGSITMT